MDCGQQTVLHRLISIVHRLSSMVRLCGLSQVAWLLTNMSFLIPAKHLRETDTLLAFHHPKPSNPFHVILLPKKTIRSFTELESADPFLADLVENVQSLVAEYQLPSYRLIVNGGDYQDFPHLHFHLVSDLSVSHSL